MSHNKTMTDSWLNAQLESIPEMPFLESEDFEDDELDYMIEECICIYEEYLSGEWF